MDWYAENPQWQLFGIAYLILVLKMIAVGNYTTIKRIRSGIFATPEDARLFGAVRDESAREAIERSRRAHLNDLENILPFFGVGVFYAMSNPSTTMAALYYFGFAAARVAHSIAYLNAWQPHRTISFSLALGLMLAMMISTFAALL